MIPRRIFVKVTGAFQSLNPTTILKYKELCILTDADLEAKSIQRAVPISGISADFKTNKTGCPIFFLPITKIARKGE